MKTATKKNQDTWGASQSQKTLAPLPMHPDRIPQLDGVRGLAVLTVILFHFLNNPYLATDQSNLNKVEVLISKATSLGWSGVNLFFVLSGYLIGSILLKNKGSHSFFKVFYIRRFARIIPIYYVLLICYIIARNSALYDPHASMFGGFPVGYYFLFLQNFLMSIKGTFGSQALTPTWSLAVEEQFYLIIPWVIYFLKRSHLKYFIGLCLVMAPICRYFSPNWYAEYTFLLCRIDSPVIGFLIAYLLSSEDVKAWLAKNIKLFTITVIGIIAICAVTYSFTQIGFLNHSILGVIFGSFVLLVTQIKKGLVYRFLTLKPLILLGKYSYCIYLFHQIINFSLHLVILNNQNPRLDNYQAYAVTLLSFIVAYVFAVVSFRFFEKPLLNWAHKFKY